MLWELSVAEQRYRAVLEVGIGVPVAEVAERYGVSRQSVHTWLVRYRQEGIAGLEDRSHQVHHHPWRIPAEIEEAICELRRAHPKWGPRRLVFEVGRRGCQVTRSSVYRTLVRNGLIEPKSRRRRRKEYRRWERSTAMELWQLDVTASAFLTGGTEVKIVTGVDDHSRFCVIAKAVMRATARPVCLAFVDAMRVYGVPEEVLTDNGKVFTGRFHKPGVPVEVLFDRICRENGITHRLTKIHSPPRPGRSSGCTRPCSGNCSTCMARLRASRRCKRRWMPGARSTTPTDRTSRWAWPSRPAGSRQHPRRWSCASPPSSR
jgi:transposase